MHYYGMKPTNKLPSFAKRDAVTHQQRILAADMLADPAKFTDLQISWAKLVIAKYGAIEQPAAKPQQKTKPEQEGLF